jgi:hypothetical protein
MYWKGRTELCCYGKDKIDKVEEYVSFPNISIPLKLNEINTLNN